MKTFAIHESNLDRLHKKVNRIRNKCMKYGCDFHYAEIGEEFREVTHEDGSTTDDRFVLVECEGTAKINGWRFAATIDHTLTGNIIRKMIDDVEVPERYRTAEPECEHCHSRRHRKDTYLVYNDETGEFKQVGSSCLCDFTGGLDAEVAAGYISLFDELISFEAPGEGYSGKTWYEVRNVLRYAVDYVNNLGYAPTTDSVGDYNPDSTKEKVVAALDYDARRSNRYQTESVEAYRTKFGEHFKDDAILDEVETILRHFQETEEDNDYINNLRVIANSDYIEYRNIGYTVSMVAAYNRHIQKVTEAKRRAEAHAAESAASEFVGEVKDRITINNPEITAITSWDSGYGYYGSIVTRYKIVDESGNVFMWDSSTGIFVGNDDKYHVASIKGTVKKHDTFRDVKQTWLTRCKVEYKTSEKSAETPKPYTGPDYDAIMDDFENCVANM